MIEPVTTAAAASRVPILVTCVSLFVGSALQLASAQAHTSTEPWNGLTDFRTLAGSLGFTIDSPKRIDVGSLHPDDALVIIGPQSPLPVAGLAAFLRAGGRIAIFDDYGPSEDLLAAYQITRGKPAPRGVPALREDPRLLVAQPASEHPLTAGVAALLTNNASRLFHPDLRAVFTYGQTEQALVLAGAVGAGRLIAVGDSSVLINQHLALPAHAQFAQNLLQYLDRGDGRTLVVAPGTKLHGNFGQPHQSGFKRLNAWLGRIARPDLPPGALAVLGLALGAITFVFAAGALPRRSPYLRTDLFPERTVWAGYAGRVASGTQQGVNLLWTALDYRYELESEVARLLGMDGAFHASAAVIATTRRTGSDTGQQLRELLQQLSGLADAEDRPEGPPRVGPEDLQDMVRKGERVIEAIERATQRA